MTHRLDEDYFEVREVARRANVSIDTVRRRMRAGAFPRARRDAGPNAPWRIPLGDLVAAGLAPFSDTGPSRPSPGSSVDRRVPPRAADPGSATLTGHVAVLEELVAVLNRQIEQLRSASEWPAGREQRSLAPRANRSASEEPA